jgi:hypothetical protein
LPSLVQANDPTTTSKVLSIALSIINGASQNGTMASVGVTMLAIIYQHQPRVWQELKKVLTDWILRRKSRTFRRRIDLSETGTIKLELAVLTTMRDLCKTRPRECAPDILPMVMSLLQTCQDLSMASLSVLVETISHCTESGLVEPRSIWTIAVRYIADFAMNNGIRQSKLVIKQLCKFFGIAGKNEDGKCSSQSIYGYI